MQILQSFRVDAKVQSLAYRDVLGSLAIRSYNSHTSNCHCQQQHIARSTMMSGLLGREIPLPQPAICLSIYQLRDEMVGGWGELKAFAICDFSDRVFRSADFSQCHFRFRCSAILPCLPTFSRNILKYFSPIN